VPVIVVAPSHPVHTLVGLGSAVREHRGLVGVDVLGRVVALVDRVVPAAREGRVDTLVVAPGPPTWGRVDPHTGAVAVADGPAADSDDLLDRAIADTLLNAGTAFVVNADDLQHQRSRPAALLTTGSDRARNRRSIRRTDPAPDDDAGAGSAS